jgi:hypothetical protein
VPADGTFFFVGGFFVTTADGRAFGLADLDPALGRDFTATADVLFFAFFGFDLPLVVFEAGLLPLALLDRAGNAAFFRLAGTFFTRRAIW